MVNRVDSNYTPFSGSDYAFQLAFASLYRPCEVFTLANLRNDRHIARDLARAAAEEEHRIALQTRLNAAEQTPLPNSRPTTPNDLIDRHQLTPPPTEPRRRRQLPPQQPVPPRHRRKTMHAPPPIFSGDSKENPTDFLRGFLREVGQIPSAEIAQAFENYLKAGSDADAWYDGLPLETKASWILLRPAFEAQYPKTAHIKKTVAEYEDELMARTLKEDELGEKISKAGMEKWTHVAWAEDVLHIAKMAGFADGTNYISLVRKSLPDLLKQKVLAQHANWAAFAKAITDVEIDFIIEGATRLKKQAADNRLLEARIKQLERASSVPASPTAPLRTRLAQTHITPTSPQNPSRTFNSPRVLGGFPQPAFRFTAERYEEPRASAFRARIDTLPHHPDTEQGRAAYKLQVLAWVTKHGANTIVSDTTPVPLTPGTENTGTRECFICGQHGHRNPCPQIMAQGPKVPRNEQDWRRLIWANLGAFRARTAAAFYVDTDLDDPFLATAAELAALENQGKEEGSST